MGEILDNFIFALKKIGSAEEKRALDTANSFQKSYIEYFQHTSDKLKTQTTQWGMYALQLNRQRLDKKGLTMQVCLKNSKQQANSVLAGKDGKYTIYEVHKFMKKELLFFLNNKKIKRYQKDCEIVFDVIETVNSQNEYTCPYCGYTDVIEIFLMAVNTVIHSLILKNFRAKLIKSVLKIQQWLHSMG